MTVRALMEGWTFITGNKAEREKPCEMKVMMMMVVMMMLLMTRVRLLMVKMVRMNMMMPIHFFDWNTHLDNLLYLDTEKWTIPMKEMYLIVVIQPTLPYQWIKKCKRTSGKITKWRWDGKGNMQIQLFCSKIWKPPFSHYCRSRTKLYAVTSCFWLWVWVSEDFLMFSVFDVFPISFLQ